MARYPGATYRPIVMKGRKALTIVNRANLHVTDSLVDSQFGYMNGPRNPDSHFHIALSGYTEQYVDTFYRANADLEGNDATISIETAGKGDGQWTVEQCIAIINLLAWIVKTHGVQLRLATSSKLGAESKGISWHRLGIDGNFPALPSIQAGRLQRGGGMHYSNARGKVCPGNARIEQIPGIYGEVVRIIEGTVVNPLPPINPTPPTPIPPNGLDEDGLLGPATVKFQQRKFGTPEDGVISQPTSQLTWAIQEWLNARGFTDKYGRKLVVDGKGYYQNQLGTTPVTHTQYALQRYLAQTPSGRAIGYGPDGKWGSPSIGIKILQQEANAGRLFA